MKRKLFVGILAVVLAVSASVAIHATVNGGDYEPVYVVQEAVLSCCVADVSSEVLGVGIAPTRGCPGWWPHLGVFCRDCPPDCNMGMFSCC